MSAFAVLPARLFDGERMQEDRAVLVESGRIASVVPPGKIPPSIEVRRVDGLLAPGFVDVQVNGGGGVLFNDEPTVRGIRAIGAAHRKFGTTGFLPTLITDTRAKMQEALAAVREGLATGVPGLLGVHLEGPFINPAKKGVHDPKYMRTMEDEDIRLIASLGVGRTLVTLAPEKAPQGAIARLTQAGAIVAAGHTEASVEELEKARVQGMRGYTHLFNAMPPLASRAPGPVGAALDERESWCSLIVDMHHVSAPALRVALAARGTERMLLVTDAMPTVGTDLQSFVLLGEKVTRRNGRLTTGKDTLAGSDLDMASAVRNTVQHLGVDLPTALRMASLVPAGFLKLDQQLGRIAPGYRASMVLLGDGIAVRKTWIDGEEESSR